MMSTSDALGELAGSRRALLHAAASCGQTSWKYDTTSKIRLRQSMRIYLKNNSTKFHPDPIWNDRDIAGLFEERRWTRRTRRRTARWLVILNQFLLQKNLHSLSVRRAWSDPDYSRLQTATIRKSRRTFCTGEQPRSTYRSDAGDES